MYDFILLFVLYHSDIYIFIILFICVLKINKNGRNVRVSTILKIIPTLVFTSVILIESIKFYVALAESKWRAALVGEQSQWNFTISNSLERHKYKAFYSPFDGFSVKIKMLRTLAECRSSPKGLMDCLRTCFAYF